MVIGILGTIALGLSEEFLKRAFEEWGFFTTPSRQLETVWQIVLSVFGFIGSILGSIWFLLPAAYVAGFLTYSFLNTLEVPNSEAEQTKRMHQNIYGHRYAISNEIDTLRHVLSPHGFERVETMVTNHQPQFRSFLYTLQKAGLTCPDFVELDRSELQFALEWLQQISPLINDGHIPEAQDASTRVSNYFNTQVKGTK